MSGLVRQVGTFVHSEVGSMPARLARWSSCCHKLAQSGVVVPRQHLVSAHACSLQAAKPAQNCQPASCFRVERGSLREVSHVKSRAYLKTVAAGWLQMPCSHVAA